MAQGFWQLLIPHGLEGGALSHVPAGAAGLQDEDGDEPMDGSTGGSEEGWQSQHTQWWFEFLEQSGIKGVSKDVWQMVSGFSMSVARVVDARREGREVG